LFARGHDVDPRYYEKCVADDVEIDYGEALTFQGLAALRQVRKDNWADASNPDGRFKFTQHLISNTLVEIDGDTARSQCYVQASHGLVGEDGKLAVVPVGAIYTQHSARTPAGWRVTRHHCRLLWIHDPDGLMPDSAAMMDDPTRREGLLW
jgi:SnoaL-like domain